MMLPSLFFSRKREGEKEKGVLVNQEEITILNFYACLYVQLQVIQRGGKNEKSEKKNLKNSLLECMIECISLTTQYIKHRKIRRKI